MTVRLLKPHNGQNAGTLYFGADESALRAVGIADDYIESAANYVPSGAQAFRALAATFSTSAPAGSFVTALSNPFAGQGRGFTTYATQGVVPAQLALSASGRSLVIGANAGVNGTIYPITLVATSGDGLLTSQPVTLNLKAVDRLTVPQPGVPGVTPTPSPTPTPGDTTAPTLSNATGTQTGQTTATVGVTTNEGNGSLYWYLSTSNTPPTVANLKNGSGSVLSGIQSVSATGAQTVNITGLTAATQYYTHWLHRDAALNDSAILTGPGFVTAAASGSAMRTITANMIGQAADSGDSVTGEAHAFRWGYPIGSGDVSETNINLHGWYSNNGAQTNVPELTIPILYAIYNGVAVRCTQNGSNTIVVPSGANFLYIDKLLPSQFGATKFTLETLILLKGWVKSPDGTANGTRVPTSQTVQVANDTTNNEAFWFNPTSPLGLPTNFDSAGVFTFTKYTPVSLTSSGTVATVQVNGTDPLPVVGQLVTISGASPNAYNLTKRVTAVDGTARTFTYALNAATTSPATTAGTYENGKFARASGYRPNIFGKFVSGDPETWIIGGDSIDQGINGSTSTAGPWGIGRNAMSLRDASGNTGYKAYMSLAVGGSSVEQFTGSNTLTHPYMALGRYAMGAHLTNSFGIPGTGRTGAAMLSEMQPWWAKLKEMGVEKILALGAQTRGTSPNNWTTEPEQTINPGWQAGGNVEQYYALLPAEISAGRITAFLNFQSWRGTDPNKWKVTGANNYATSDSTHPSNAIHVLEAAEIRTAKAAMGI
ncbi:hypothetical protein HNO88_000318 [Novosphingobium chloroacetimidivorans]|uniref:Uncharacterized protein n=1 Tax=Novosphingobium chloroacetimidivorans TaxID=1428314 RepID=A0A7W7K6E8_9SPHN|nr:hypothetical protein [Novosphingobium chloroacetimidivorans]MBB4857021.1 hypothetical protein [Novosphingobium chloroacetimidivorans]